MLSNEPVPASLAGFGVERWDVVCLIAFIATAIIEPTSETLAGKMSVLLVLASSPNLLMYCSATRS